MTDTTPTTTPEGDTLRAEAAHHERLVQESWDRSDTDGFLSQWANGITAQEARAKAELADAGNVGEAAALFDLDGNLVAAKLVQTRYGSAWMLMDSDDPRTANCAGWVNRSKAAKAKTRNKNLRAKGYQEGTVLAPMAAKIMGSGTGLAGAASCYVGRYRTDGGFSRDVTVLATSLAEDGSEDW